MEDLFVLFITVGFLLLIGVFGGNSKRALVKGVSGVAGRILYFAILAACFASITYGVQIGRQAQVYAGAIQGIWSGALVGAWLRTRRHRDRHIHSKAEAFADGLAETFEGALVGAVVGGIVMYAHEAVRGAWLGAMIGAAGWTCGRVSNRSWVDKIVEPVAAYCLHCWGRFRHLRSDRSIAELSFIGVIAEGVLSALFGAVAFSITAAAISGWVDLPTFDHKP